MGGFAVSSASLTQLKTSDDSEAMVTPYYSATILQATSILLTLNRLQQPQSIFNVSQQRF